MNPVGALHDQAMLALDDAWDAERHGRGEEAAGHRSRALEYAVQAAEAVADDGAPEPSRSVLHRSAASIAVECGDFALAQRLIHRALAGNPPPSIAGELRDLLEQAAARRHLAHGE